MVAQTLPLPNLRKFFVPDPGHMILEADLAGADAQVVAWEAEDEDLKAAFRAGVNVHIKNARDMFPAVVKSWSDEAIKKTSYPGGIYYTNKRATHASNYGVTPRTMASKLGWTVRESEAWQRNWFGLHPRIPAWHRRTTAQLQQHRRVTNKFGYHRIYFDRIDGLLPEALAWVPQSTVAINCNHGGLNIRRNLPDIKLLLQVHDSLVMQYPVRWHTKHNLDLLTKTLSVTIPYDDPLVIPWGLKASEKSWGDCTKV